MSLMCTSMSFECAVNWYIHKHSLTLSLHIVCTYRSIVNLTRIDEEEKGTKTYTNTHTHTKSNIQSTNRRIIYISCGPNLDFHVKMNQCLLVIMTFEMRMIIIILFGYNIEFVLYVHLTSKSFGMICVLFQCQFALFYSASSSSSAFFVLLSSIFSISNVISMFSCA